jgi:hypothetical protein
MTFGQCMQTFYALLLQTTIRAVNKCDGRVGDQISDAPPDCPAAVGAPARILLNTRQPESCCMNMVSFFGICTYKEYK